MVLLARAVRAVSAKATPVFEYKDTGCTRKTGPRSCLACPLAICVLDVPAEREPSVRAAAQRQRIMSMLRDGRTHPEIMASLGIARATIYKAIQAEAR